MTDVPDQVRPSRKTLPSRPSPQPAEIVLAKLKGLGIELSREGNHLRFRAPRGSMTAHLRDEVAKYKPQILGLLAVSTLIGGAVAPERDSPTMLIWSASGKQTDISATADPALGLIAVAPDGHPTPNSHNSQNTSSSDLEGISANCANNPRDQQAVLGPCGLRDTLAPEVDGWVVLGDQTLGYQRRWKSQQLRGELIALDCETAPIRGNEIPPLALVSASDGWEHVIIHPDDVGRFVLAHRRKHLVVHNIQFDLPVLEKQLRQRSEFEARECLWQMIEENRAHDTLLLDELYRLAMYDSYPRARDLGTLAREYAGLEIDKSDPYRLRYGEIIGQPWDEIDTGFLEYAIKDAVATLRVHAVLRQKAVDCAHRNHVRDDTIRRWGVLTESIQIRGALALAQLTRNGLHLDLNRSTSVRRAVQEKIDKHVARIRQHRRSRGLFKIDPKSGEPRITKSQAPSLSNKVLQEILTEVAAEIEHDTGLPLEIPRTEKGQVSTSAKEWADHAPLHPFVVDWVEMAEAFTLARFLEGLAQEIVHPRYTTLVRSGRTSCSSPNIQQLPRKGGFREVFVPSRGHFLLTVDYSFIELRTLAAVCEARYGKSTLAEVIRAGRDPHAYSAALLLGQDPDEFVRLQQTDPGKFKSQRQAAKALNFGIPGGLGAASLVNLARRTYGVEMSLEEAARFREKMISEVYPEWSAYLAEDSMTILAQNLETSVDRCWQILDWQGTRSPSLVWAIRRIVRGETVRKDGKPYNSRFVNGTWSGLQQVNRSEVLAPLLSRRQGSVELDRMLFHAGIVTLTGRVRGRVAFSQARNTPFQGLAADGAKLALWRLNREGFRVVGFVHDEFLIELPDEGGFVSEEKVLRVKEILCSEMENVLGGELPVACEATLSTCWSKDARLTVHDGRVYPWTPVLPPNPPTMEDVGCPQS